MKTLILICGLLTLRAEEDIEVVPEKTVDSSAKIVETDTDTDSELQPIDSIQWQIDATNIVSMAKQIKLTTNWVNLTPIAGKAKGSLVNVQEMGTIYTNLVITVAYKGRSNHVVIDVLGREEWPSQQRKRTARVQ